MMLWALNLCFNQKRLNIEQKFKQKHLIVLLQRKCCTGSVADKWSTNSNQMLMNNINKQTV